MRNTKEQNEITPENPVRAARPARYEQPQLKRWGTLRELTAGGGGDKNEPATKMKTRF